MVIPIFIHKHDQQIPRSMEWRGVVCAGYAQFVCGCGQLVCCGSQQLLSSICSFCSSYWGSSIALFLVRCVQVLRIVRLFRIHSSSIQFKSIHGVWMWTLWASSTLSIALSRSQHTFAIHFERHSLRCIAPFKRLQSGFVLQSNGYSTTNVS